MNRGHSSTIQTNVETADGWFTRDLVSSSSGIHPGESSVFYRGWGGSPPVGGDRMVLRVDASHRGLT